jgi:hypothetical protein
LAFEKLGIGTTALEDQLEKALDLNQVILLELGFLKEKQGVIAQKDIEKLESRIIKSSELVLEAYKEFLKKQRQ